MFVVVEHFLPNLDHFVSHVFNFRHSLCEDKHTDTFVIVLGNNMQCHSSILKPGRYYEIYTSLVKPVGGQSVNPP